MNPFSMTGGAIRQGFFESVLEVLPEFVLIHDETTILFANAACRRFLGADSPQDIEGLPLDIIIHSDAYDAGRERRRLLIESERAFRSVPLKVVTLDGEPKHLTADAHPLAVKGIKAAMVIARAERA